MKKRTGLATFLMMLALLVFLPVRADAAWKKNSAGSYSWYNSAGVKMSSQWFAEKQVGFVTSGNTTYCYKLNGNPYKGWLTVGGKKYYIAAKGKMLKSKWIISGNKKYFASKNGNVYTNCIVKIGSAKYGFNSNGIMQKGKVTINKKTYYFLKDTGKMVTKAFVKINGKKYYFGSNGVLGKKLWVNKQYVNASGYVQGNVWVGDKYAGSDGKAVKGLQKINGVYYYFDTSTYKKVKNTTKTIDKVTYKFDANGKGTIVKEEDKINDSSKPSCSVQKTYHTDPKVSDEVLLSAIIYCESGNQPYYGQLAVGMVITNRMRSSQFPNKLKEVVYQTSQFSPTFDGALTRVLKNQSLITSSCKKAAKEVLSMYKANKYTIKAEVELKDKTEDGKKTEEKNLNLKNYVFFMTKGAYDRLGMKSEYVKLKDHVFFEKWKR